MTESGQPTIDVLMVADWAEAINGKLYVMGGGFTAVSVIDPSTPHRFAVAAVLTVPAGWSQSVPLSTHLEDSAGKRLGDWKWSGSLDLNPSAEQAESAVIAGLVEVLCPAEGEVVVCMRFGCAERSVAFAVVPHAKRSRSASSSPGSSPR